MLIFCNFMSVYNVVLINKFKARLVKSLYMLKMSCLMLFMNEEIIMNEWNRFHLLFFYQIIFTK